MSDTAELDRAFWEQRRRALLTELIAIERRFGFRPRCPYRCDACASGTLSNVVHSTQPQEVKQRRFLGDAI